MGSMDGMMVEKVRNALLERWQRIGKAAADQDSGTREGVEPQAEVIDIAQHLEQLGRDVSLAEQERRELAAIERALAKIAVGNFGVCEDCGDEIPERRMLAVPEACLCTNCQAFEERQHARTRAM